MFTVSATKMLNEAGRAELTPGALWRAMVHHVRTGDQRFVPPGHMFELVSDDGREIFRRAILGEAARSVGFIQRVSLHAERAMLMSTVDGPLNIRIMTIEADDAGAYYLHLMHTASVRGAAHGSAQEREIAQVRRQSVEESVARFVEAARTMVAGGELSAMPPHEVRMLT